MVHQKTVIVVGAGASCAYGMPLGADLLRAARGARVEDFGAVYEVVRLHAERSHRVPLSEVTACYTDLDRFVGPSIDDFLEKRQERPSHQIVGRALIAALVGRELRNVGLAGNPEISRPAGGPPKDDWIRTLGLRLTAGAPTLQHCLTGNQVSFVTFNFDSILELRLRHHLEATYDCRLTEAELTAHWPIHHVHGRLPDPPEDHLSTIRCQDWLPWLSEGASAVRVVADQLDEDQLASIAAAVDEATRLCFLGFAFHPNNVKRLGLPNRRPTIKVMYATVYGLRGAAIAAAARSVEFGMNKLHHPGASATCSDLLEDLDVLV